MFNLQSVIHYIITGTYIYAEASDGSEGDQAKLVSTPEHKATSDSYCLSVWYHMHGSGMGRLDILYVNVNNTSKSKYLMNRIGMFIVSVLHSEIQEEAMGCNLS